MADKTNNSIEPAHVVFFIIMWVVFAVLGCWGGISSGWNVGLSLVVGVVGGFIVDCIFMVFIALGIDI
jgi:hypothetical protein